MFGRFEIHSALEIIAKIFRIETVTSVIKPGCNAAPGRNGVVKKSRPLHSLLV